MNATAQVSSPKKDDHAPRPRIFQRILNRAHFENDGAELEETEAVVLIQSQAGVQEFGQLIFGYSSATEKLEIEYVRVRKPDGQVIETSQRGAGFRSRDSQRSAHVQRLPAAARFGFEPAAGRCSGISHDGSRHDGAGGGKFLVRVLISQGSRDPRKPAGNQHPQSPRNQAEKSETQSPEIRTKGDRRIYTWEVKDFTPTANGITRAELDNPIPMCK